ncbi:MAG: hypothetical protein KF882_09290 [Bacteroidia bacterium]|nr:hypothetical protein [Bacteroidia bacterium]MCO5253679.1 hypothetical protein [Bacteroidota bacterium]
MQHYVYAEISTFLYVIFGILYLLYKYSASKKGKEKNTPKHSHPKVEILEQLEELLKKKSSIKIDPIPAPIAPPIYNYQKTPQKKPISQNLDLVDIDEQDNSDGSIMGVSAKEAIILSEILKRPEY